jgi:hypothetical protein
MKVLSLLVSFAAAVSALAIKQADVAQDLKSLVSSSLSVSVELPARWSDYNTPVPHVVVKVETEKDVAAIVCSCPRSAYGCHHHCLRLF